MTRPQYGPGYDIVPRGNGQLCKRITCDCDNVPSMCGMTFFLPESTDKTRQQRSISPVHSSPFPVKWNNAVWKGCRIKKRRWMGGLKWSSILLREFWRGRSRGIISFLFLCKTLIFVSKRFFSTDFDHLMDKNWHLRKIERVCKKLNKIRSF